MYISIWSNQANPVLSTSPSSSCGPQYFKPGDLPLPSERGRAWPWLAEILGGKIKTRTAPSADADM
jgi:hypothetical protein